MKAAIEAANKELEAIRAKNSELLNETKAAKQKKREAEEAAQQAAEEAARKAGDAEALEKSLNEKFRAELEKSAAEKNEAMAQLHKLTVDNTITNELARNKVIPAFQVPLKAMFLSNKFDIKDGLATVGDKPLNAIISEYLESDDGRMMVLAPHNSGGNSSGPSTSSTSGFTKDTFNMTEQSKMIKSDPEKYKSICVELGIKPVI